MEVLYEDNHIIIVNKQSGEIVQGDKTGDTPLSDIVKGWIRAYYNKPGNIFLGVVHRLDRPVSGLVVFAKTSKALSRLNAMFANHNVKISNTDDYVELKEGEVSKTYWAITINAPCQPEGTLVHWLIRNEKQNKSYAYDSEKPNSKKAILKYKVIKKSDRYCLIEVKLLTGRHHQIRCQLSKIGCPIKGDLKYGANRSNSDGSISLIARNIRFIHPVSKKLINITAPVPDDSLWKFFESSL